MLCSWCDEPASWVLVTDADLHNHDHPACDEHRGAWVHLYRRAVAVADGVAADDTVDVDTLDLRDGSSQADAAVDLRGADEPIGRHER